MHLLCECVGIRIPISLHDRVAALPWRVCSSANGAMAGQIVCDRIPITLDYRLFARNRNAPEDPDGLLSGRSSSFNLEALRFFKISS